MLFLRYLINFLIISTIAFTYLFINIPIYATETRVHSLNGDANILKDISNVYSYPSVILNYPKFIVAEYIGETGYANIHWLLGPGVMGISLNRNYSDMQNLKSYIQMYEQYYTMNGLSISPDPNPQIELMYGLDVEGKSIAFRIARAANGKNLETEDNKTETSCSITNIDIGLSYEYNTKINFDLTAGLKFYSLKAFNENSDGTGKELKNKGGTGFFLRGRLFYQTDKNLYLVPCFSFDFGGYPSIEIETKTKVGDNIQTVKDDLGDPSALNLSIGVGANYQPNENILGILGIYFNRYSTTIKDKNANTESFETNLNYIFPRILAGVEIKSKSWITTRFGAGYNISWFSYEKEERQKINEEWEVIKTKGSDPQNAIYDIRFGLGFKFGQLQIDTELNRGLVFRQGPNVISGQSNDLFINASITYFF